MTAASSTQVQRSAATARIGAHRWRMLIDGKLVDALEGGNYEVEDPSTEMFLARAPNATQRDLDYAYDSADRAFRIWRHEVPRSRAGILRSSMAEVEKHADELALLDALNSGMPQKAMRAAVARAINMVHLLCDLAADVRGDVLPLSHRHLNYAVGQPFGVVARIVPFNHPAFYAIAKCAAPLLAGNALIFKPAEATPLSALRFGEIIADALPPGLVSILTSGDAHLGRAIVRHPDIRRIGFIGSVQTGLAIQREAATSSVKQLSLELGGKNALIVLPDADLEAAADAAVTGMAFSSTGGQSCGSTSRVLLHHSIADRVLTRICSRIQAIRVGDPLATDTDMGALSSRAQYQKTVGYVEQGLAGGATLAEGGVRPAELHKGYFFRPTVFSNVRPEMSIAREEIFGPVMSVMTFGSEAEAIEIANGLDFGLTASVWTTDLATAGRFIRALDAGYVWINDVGRHFDGAPFGGFKNSGIGREESREEIESFCQIKTVSIAM